MARSYVLYLADQAMFLQLVLCSIEQALVPPQICLDPTFDVLPDQLVALALQQRFPQGLYLSRLLLL